jgi:hypothetical protein
MIFVRELTSERAPTAIAVAHHMAKKTNKEHTVRFDRESQRWFVHPRWRVHPPDGQVIENDSYFGLGDWFCNVLPTDPPPSPKFVVPELS